MRKYLAIGLMLLLGDFAFASANVTDLPVPVRLFAECETNVLLNVGAPKNNIWTIFLQLDASPTNCVEIGFGQDCNLNDCLDLHELDFCVGWDCGQWYWRDNRIDQEERVDSDASILQWFIRLNADKTVKSTFGDIFSLGPQKGYDLRWNMLRVVSCGANALDVESKLSMDSFRLIVK